MGSDNERSQIDFIIAEILKSEEEGRTLTADDWCARYKHHAESIREFFTNREQLGLSKVFEGADMPTMAPDGDQPEGFATGEAIRYFGDYEVIEEIARGGMGVVYKAKQTSLQRTVALKMILSGELASAEHVARFQTEAESAARLDHPGIVPIYEIGEHNGQHYFSMAFVPGRSLADRIADGPLPPKEAAEIVAAAADALQYAHDLEVIHRDLKPANILMDGDRPKLTDFGLAKRLDQQSVTRTGEVLGTPGYMAPEQASNAESADKLSDVYGLGAILYATLTGRPPFQAANVLETMCQVLDSDPVPPGHLNAAVPVDLETICLAALRKEPQRRYASAAELKADLQRFLEGRPIHARPVSTFEHIVKWAKRRPMIAGLASALVATLVLGSVVIGNLWLQERSARESANDAAKIATENEKKAKEAAADAVRQKEIAEEQRTIAQNAIVTNSLNMAERMYVERNYAVAEQRYLHAHRSALERGGNDRRAWWGLWRLYSECPRESRLTVTGNYVTTSPDGQFVAVVSGNRIQLLDGNTFEPQRDLVSPIGVLSEAGFGPNGRFVLANHFSEAEVLVWDTENPESEPYKVAPPEAAEFPGVMKMVIPMVGGTPGSIKAANKWLNRQTGFLLREDNHLLIAGGAGLWEYDVSSFPSEPVKLANRGRANATHWPSPLACEEDRVWLSGFSGVLDNPLCAVDLADDRNTAKARLTLTGTEGDSLTDIPSPSSFLSALSPRIISDPKQREQLFAPSVYAVDRERLRLAAVKNNELSLWDLRSRKRIGVHPKQEDRQSRLYQRPSQNDNPWKSAVQVVFSNDGDRVVVVGDEIRVLDANTLTIQQTFGYFGKPDRVSVAFTADGEKLLVTDRSDPNSAGRIGVYSLARDNTHQDQIRTGSPRFAPVITSDGSLFLRRRSGGGLFSMGRLDISRTRGENETQYKVPRTGKFRGLNFDRQFSVAGDGSRCVLSLAGKGDARSEVLVSLDTSTGEFGGPHDIDDVATGVTLSSNGKLMSRLVADSIIIESLPGFESVARIPIQERGTTHATSIASRLNCWAADDRFLCAIFNRINVDVDSGLIQSSGPDEVAIVDVEKGKLLSRGLFPGARAATFLDSNQIAIAAYDGTSVVKFCSLGDFKVEETWDLGTDYQIKAICENKKQGTLAVVTSQGDSPGSRIWLWDLRRSEPLTDFEVAKYGVHGMNWTDDGMTIRLATSVGLTTVDLAKVSRLVDSYVGE